MQQLCESAPDTVLDRVERVLERSARQQGAVFGTTLMLVTRDGVLQHVDKDQGDPIDRLLPLYAGLNIREAVNAQTWFKIEDAFHAASLRPGPYVVALPPRLLGCGRHRQAIWIVEALHEDLFRVTSEWSIRGEVASLPAAQEG